MSWTSPRWSPRTDRQRTRALARLPDGPGAAALRRYLETPLPDPETPIGELRLLAVDMETTGLDPRRDRWLSVGWVPLDPAPVGHEIVLGGSGSAVISSATAQGVGESATVHGLTDDVVATGRPLADVVDDLLDALAGRVLLAHFARIEVGQLIRAVRDLHGVDLPLTSVDTLELQFRLWGSDETRIPDGALRLWAARDQYGLPEYPAHDAYVDALACAELFLAQVADEQLPRGAGRLRDLQ